MLSLPERNITDISTAVAVCWQEYALSQPQPFTLAIRKGNRSGLHRGETSGYASPASGGPARFHRLLCPLLTSARKSNAIARISVRIPAPGRCLFSLFAAWFPGGATISRPYLWGDIARISRGEHASLRTRAPSIPAWPIMDRGLYRVLPARPTKPA